MNVRLNLKWQYAYEALRDHFYPRQESGADSHIPETCSFEWFGIFAD